MKKVISFLFVVLLLFSFTINVDAKKKAKTTKKETVSCANKINLHLFWGNGCPHCEEMMEYLDGLSDDYKACFNLVKHEVWYDKAEKALMQKVATYFNESVGGVPYYVIGEKSYSGFATSGGDELKAAIVKAANDENYKDVVTELSNSNDKEDDKTADSVITVIIILVAIAGVIVLAKTSMSKK